MIGNVVKNPSGNINLGPITVNGNYNFDVGRYKTASVSVTVEQPHIYGVTWSGGSSPVLTRTDDAVNFPNPNPYYSGMSSTPYSPFDGLMPWAGIRRVTDATAGELVEIPKFWYKLAYSGTALQLQIADAPVAGFQTSPAHSDRGDGVGERDYIYVGRYQCASDYKSKTGVNPKGNIERAALRTNIHALGSNVWQFDFLTLFTIQMLYLVEYATWDCQAAISYGTFASPSSGATVVACGGTDSMPYHTGTTASSKTSYSNYMQYRYIEGAWSNAEIFVDGITSGDYGAGCATANKGGVYLIKNPANFTDNANVGDYIGVAAPQSTAAHVNVSGNIKSFINTDRGFIPAEAENNSNYDTYGCANVRIAGGSSYPKHGRVLIVGGGTTQWRGAGIFGWGADVPYEGWSYGSVGGRLMVLPSSRII